MGFNRRYLSEEVLRRNYEKGGRKAIFQLYSTADAILTQDKFSSEVTDLFAQKLDEKTLSSRLRELFKCQEFEKNIHRKISAFSSYVNEGIESVRLKYPEAESFVTENQNLTLEDVRTILLKQL
jgi:hypothetical protein